jgi:hypothetical protein
MNIKGFFSLIFLFTRGKRTNPDSADLPFLRFAPMNKRRTPGAAPRGGNPGDPGLQDHFSSAK